MGKVDHPECELSPISPESDPAKILEASLLEMDGILAGVEISSGPLDASAAGVGRAARARALELAAQLAGALQHAAPPPPRPDYTTAAAVLRWLQPPTAHHHPALSLLPMSDLWAHVDGGQHCQQAANGVGSISDSDDSCGGQREDVGEREEWEGEEDDEEEGRESVVEVSGLHPAVSSYMYSVMGSDSDSPDDSSTIKCGTWSDSNFSADHRNSSSSDSSSSSGMSHKQKGETVEDSTRCDDFQWIKSEPAATASYDKANREIAPVSDEEGCNKILKSKRTDVPTKFCSDKPPVPNSHDRSGSGSLDRRRYHHTSRVDRDQKSKSTHNLKGHQQSPSRQYSNGSNYRNNNESPGPPVSYPVDYAGNHLHETYQPQSTDYPHQYHSFTPPRQLGDYSRKAVSYEHFNRRHEHNDPQRYGSNSMLMDHQTKDPYKQHMDYHGYHHDMRNVPYQYGSRPELHGSHGELPYYPGPAYPSPSHLAPSCCCHPAPPWCGYSDQGRYRTPSGCKNSEAVDDKVRRLESDKDSLQLQVSVLSEQIAAQSEKINDLERLLNEKRTLLTNAEELLQREMLTRSSLETQKLELMSTISDSRLRQAALERENLELRGSMNMSNGSRGMINSRTSPSPCPSPGANNHREGSTPRTPPATYRRLVNPDQSPHSYSSLPRGASLTGTPVGRPSGCSTPHHPQQLQHLQGSGPLETAVVVRFAEKDTVIGTGSPILGKLGSAGKGWGGLWRGGSGGTLEDVDGGLGRGEPFQRGGVRATAAPRLQTTTHIDRWSTTSVKEWDADITCEWLESMGLDCYNADAKKWLTNTAGNKGIIATANPQQIEKELNIKNHLHKKKIVLALLDLQGNSIDPLLAAAGRLDCAWALRWLEDLGLPQYREAWAAAGADGRVLHLLCQDDLQLLRLTSQLHALSIKRGIQVLREANFSPDTMIRRAGVPDASGVEPPPGAPPTEDNTGGSANSSSGSTQLEWGHVSRWSSHRVMEWLRAVDLAEYAPNLRGAGVHGGLMYYEVRFTGELLATLLNIPPSKTLLRRHLNTRFNQLIGKEVIQEKREAEQTLGYQPLTLTSKIKIVKKGQFTLKRKKNKGETEYADLVCPIVDQSSGEILNTMRVEALGGEGAACRQTDEMSSSTDSPHSTRSDHSRS